MAELADLPTGRQAHRISYELKYMIYVYVIKSIRRNYIYVGMTNNLDRRISQHQNKREQTTASYCPFDLVLTESFSSRTGARQREKYLKSGTGKEWLKKKFISNKNL